MLKTILVYLMSAVTFVPLAKYLGLGSVLGYLIAGILVGPEVLALVTDTQQILHVSEFGVVILMFLIGLELNPKRLWSLRKILFGLGTLQFFLTAALIAGLGIGLGFSWPASLLVGIALSLSSTAMAMQNIKERQWASTPAGQHAFGVLLFQDLAVIPVMALLPLWGARSTALPSTFHPIHSAKAILLPIVVIGLILILGRPLLRYFFRFVAGAELREVFTACALLLVMGMALGMESLGLSMALGSFLAGVLLADSEYRHELESHLEPFKGLLLGLFFLAVGMSIQFAVFVHEPVTLFFMIMCLVCVKIIILVLLAYAFNVRSGQQFLFATLLCQGSEFAFVLGALGVQQQIINLGTQNKLNAVVTFTMLLSPIVNLIFYACMNKFYKPNVSSREPDTIHERSPVLIAGFGRVGQIVARLLHASQIQTTVIDHSPEHIERVRRFGFKAYYGDATQLDLLHAAGLGDAQILVLAIDDREANLQVIDKVKQTYPHLKIVARAWDMIHVYALLDRGVQSFHRETFDSALSMGEEVLRLLGLHPFSARRAAQRFRKYDLEAVQRLHAVHKDDKQFASIARQSREELEKLFQADELDLVKNHTEGWSRP